MATLMPGEMSGVPNEYGFGQQQSNRKRKLAEALRQQALTPQGQMVGGVYVAPSITQYLASGLKGYQANEIERKADQEEKDIFTRKQKQLSDAQAKYLEALRPQQVQTGETKLPFDPAQMDRFGSPLQGAQQAAQPIMGTKQPTPEDLYMAQLQYGADVGSPEMMMNAGNARAQYQIGQQTRKEDRENKRFDIEDARKYEDIVRKDQQGFQLSAQERQFAQQFALQNQSQNFAAGQQSRAQQFQAGQNQLSRDQQLATAGAKSVGNPTESERKSATLLSRMQFSENQLREALKGNPSAAKPGLIAKGLAGAGMESLANAATPEARQQVEAAQLDILDSALTLGTGAAYTKEQLEGYRKSYFPQIGDSPKTIQDKQKRLENVIEAAKIAAGRASATPLPANNAQPQGNIRTVDW